jgi:hypothetical protein
MGKRWLLVWVAKGLGFVAREPEDGKKQTKMSQTDDGMTEAPWFKNKRLFLRHGIRNEKRRMEAAIHEFTHAADWYKDEEWVEQFGHDLTNFLYALGVRWPNPPDVEPEDDPEILEG